MEYKEIQDLLKLVNKTDLTEVLIQKDGFKIKICKKNPDNNVVINPQPAAIPATTITQPQVQVPQVAAAEPVVSKQETTTPPTKESSGSSGQNLFEFKSPMIGTFYRSASPEAEVYAKVGDQVEKGQALCIIEAMKLFNEIESEVAGKIVKIMVEDAQPVEYDQVLFLIDTNG
ncbi:MAG: acetyl-CoA carboxylase biotin carboxyl carrier protein [Bacteroidia bacterium]